MSKRLPYRIRPLLEHLEDRTVPATVRLVSGNLLVSNLLVVNGQAGVTLTATANNTFQVIDTEGGTGSASDGTYNVAGNIIVTGTNAKDNIAVNLNGKTYSGNLTINSGNGNDTVNLLSTGGAGTLSGSVTLIHTSGNESVALNAAGNASTSLTIGGSLEAVNSITAFSSFQLGNASAVTTVKGSVTLTGFSDSGTTPAVRIGAGQDDVISGQLSITNTSNNNASVVLGAAVTPNPIGVTIGSLSVNEPGSGNDTVTFYGYDATNPAVPLGTTINGATNIYMGSGNDYLNVAGNQVVTPGGQQTVFNGNVTFVAGNGNDSINIAGGTTGTGIGTQVNGNLTVKFGNGNNDFGDSQRLGGNNTGLDHSEPVITGNLNITAGNGNNVMDAFGLNVNGNDNFNFGDGQEGTAAIPFLIRKAPGGTINWTSGNGNSFLELATIFAPAANVGPQNFNVNVHFGNGADTFSIGDTGALNAFDTIGGTLSGTVAAGTSGANVFLQNAAFYTLEPNFSLINFP